MPKIAIVEEIDVGVGASLKEVIGYQDELPQYRHDCSACTFLGQFENFDLYACVAGVEPTVIARFGNEGSEYSSGYCFSFGRSKTLTEARRRAEKAGILGYNCREALYAVKQDSDAWPEFLEHIPFTPEYQITLACTSQKSERANQLFRHLVELERKTAWGQTKSDPEIQGNVLRYIVKFTTLVLHTDPLETLEQICHALGLPLGTQAA